MSGLKHTDTHVLICEHKTCLKHGGRNTARELKHCLKERELHKRVLVTKVDCLDQCERGPVLIVYPDGVWYGGVDVARVREIVDNHVQHGRVVERLVIHDMNPRRGNDAGTRG
ncbi:MAG: (2Fe-2S) ferredoxin domain-containing protein [Acidobacteriota bacterium]|nr:(2Fe-2S) ferredoxin domain-containing protein [Acidobacteriota bacterium]